MFSNLFRLFLVSIPLLLASGCMTAPDHAVPAERLVGVDRVGVLTLTSPLLHGKLVATMVFGNDSWKSPDPRLATADWVFNAVAQTVSRPALRLDEKQLADIRSPFRPRFLGSGPKPIAPGTVQRLGREKDIQMLLVFSSSISSDFLTMTNQSMEAQGLFSRRFFGRAEDYAYFVAIIEVYDTRDGTHIKELWCADGGFIAPEIEWQDSWTAYTADQQSALLSSLARTTEAVVKRSIARTEL